MPELRVHCLAMSVDGYVAGADQSLEHPLGVGGDLLHEWIVETRTFRQMGGGEGGEAGVDDDFVARGFTGIGAWILGRNMFGPIRGPWPDDDWKGWWGDEPPYHCLVLTHHPRTSLAMAGGTTFHFVTDGGGASTVQQYLRARLVDDLHVAVVPVLLCAGDRLFAGLGGGPAGYECVEFAPSSAVAHVRFARSTR
jgi:dihydrofolate reductase